MDPQLIASLLDPAVISVLDGLDYDPAQELKTAHVLRKDHGLSPQVSATVLAQAAWRKDAEAKFGPFAADMLFTRNGLAQATRLPVAGWHARRMASGSPSHVADLGCGLGADSLAFGGQGLTVSAVDADEITAAFATYNLRHLPGVTVAQGLAEDFDLSSVDALWLDPARRTEVSNARGAAKRVFDPEAFSPTLSWAFAAGEKVGRAGIKLGPGLDHAVVPEGWEAQWVSHKGDLVEAACWFGGDAVPGRNALVLDAGVRIDDTQVPEADEDRVGTLGEYLLEPDPAIIRAGLVTALCDPLSAHRISPSIAYLATDTLPEGKAAEVVKTYKVREVLPAGLKPLRKALLARGVGNVVVKKRGADIVPEQVRKQLKLPAGDPATLIFTRRGEDHVVLLADPVV